MIVCRYYSPALNEKGISEYYLILEHEGFAYQKSMKEIARTTAEAGIDVDDYDTPEAFCAAMNQALAPEKIVYKMDGRYPRIVDKVWPPKEEKKYDDEIPF